TPADGFEGFEDQIEGQDSHASGPIQGAMLKFSNQCEWLLRSGDAVSPDRELIMADVGRWLIYWLPDAAGPDWEKSRALLPGQKFPDTQALNEATPREQWIEGPNGQPRGPWENQHVVYLLDPNTMTRFSFPTSTIGGHMAVRDIVDATLMRRRIQGP